MAAFVHRLFDRLVTLADRLEAGWQETAVCMADSRLSSCSG